MLDIPVEAGIVWLSTEGNSKWLKFIWLQTKELTGSEFMHVAPLNPLGMAKLDPIAAPLIALWLQKLSLMLILLMFLLPTDVLIVWIWD